MFNKYNPPVSQLLEIGPTSMTSLIRDWLDYPGKFKIGKEHIPELISMAIDDDLRMADPDGNQVWAPVHAWRTLALLHATEAVGPLLKLMNHEEAEWERYEMFYVMSMIGFSALTELSKFVNDESNDEYARCVAIRCIAEIGYLQWNDPERKAEHILTSLLDKYHTNTGSINAYLIEGLAELRVVTALPLIEKIFTEQKINKEIIDLAQIRTHITRPVPKSSFT